MGPGTSDRSATPVDGIQFIKQVQKMNNAVLSIGWNTVWRPNWEEAYSASNINDMEQVIRSNTLINDNSKPMTVNFPIRAVYALKSQNALNNFYKSVKRNNPSATVTYTVWSKNGDTVNAAELQKFIKSYGIENIYIDLPDDLRGKLNLGNGASSLVQFGLLNLITLLMIFCNY